MLKTLIQNLFLIAVIAAAPVYAQPGERGGDRPPPPSQPQLRVDQIAQAIETIRAMHPDADWLDRITEEARRDPEEAAEDLSRFPRIVELIQLRESHPEEFALHVESAQVMREIWPLMRAYHRARRDEDQAKMDELHPQIRERVERLFELRLEMMRMEAARLQEQVDAIHDGIVELEEGKDQLIEERLKEMLEPRRDPDRRRERDRGDEDKEHRDDDRG